MGIEDVPAGKTLTEIARELDVDSSILVFSLEASGYEVAGYTPEEREPVDSVVPDILSGLFADREYDPRPVDNMIHEARMANENQSMYARMEEAVRRAEREGRL